MKTLRFARVVPVALAAFVFVAGCSKQPSNESAAHAEHVHKAPHGGTLVELGEHAYAIELLRDRDAGKLTAWILDGHAENFVRITSPEINVVAMPGGKYTPLALKAVANPTTGETVGNTSQFETTADWLKTADAFAGILTIEIKGTKFEQVPYELPK